MIMNSGEKVRPEHLKRDAYLYIRQSSLKQVIENTTTFTGVLGKPDPLGNGKAAGDNKIGTGTSKDLPRSR